MRPLENRYFGEKLRGTVEDPVQDALCWVCRRQRRSIPVKEEEQNHNFSNHINNLPQWLKEISRSYVSRYEISSEGGTSSSIGQHQHFHFTCLGFGQRQIILHLFNIVQYVCFPSMSPLVVGFWGLWTDYFASHLVDCFCHGGFQGFIETINKQKRKTHDQQKYTLCRMLHVLKNPGLVWDDSRGPVKVWYWYFAKLGGTC